MYISYIEKLKYIKTMRAMKSDNVKMMELINSRKNRWNIIKSKIWYSISHFNIGMMKNGLKDVKVWLMLKCTSKNERIQIRDHNENYFSAERIAVYTCIFGSYDDLKEPLISPDNVDYYIVTDMEIRNDSIWQMVNIDNWKKETESLSNDEKNRFFKMHPDLLFPNYNYSVYVDGAIKIITDVTECINNIGKYGMAFHAHGRRQCVYDELEVCRIYSKDTKENLRKMMQKYMEVRMPRGYGLCENGVIARRHNQENVKAIMNDWWKYYMAYAKRDQLSLPVVLFEHGIKPVEITTLGVGVENNYAFRVSGHRK